MNGLVIIADDFGLHEKVNEGIADALTNHWVHGASLMANGEAYEDVVLRIKNLNNVVLGAHLVLVGEAPLINETSLVSGSGSLYRNHKVFFFRYVFGLIKHSDIEKEIRAQIDKIIDSGVKVSFINSHQHLHLLPGITDIVIKLAKEYDVPYIRTVVARDGAGRSFARLLQSRFLSLLSKRANKKISENGIAHNSFFVGFLNAGNLMEEDIEFAKNLSKEYPDKIIELGTHPGNENIELRKKYSGWGGYNWEKEIDVLKKNQNEQTL